MIRLLTEFPEQRQMVLDDPSLIERTHEALRMVSPVMHMRRTAMEDTEIAGNALPRMKRSSWYGAANRTQRVPESESVRHDA